MSARYSITPAAAVDDKTLTNLQFRVLVTLGTYLGKSGEAAWPMQQTLADRIGCARESVVRALGVLEQRGYVKSQKAFKGRPGRHKAYLVNLEARFEGECDSSVTSECDSSVTSDVTLESLPNRTCPKNIPNRSRESAQKRATRLPEDWQPPPEIEQWAIQNGLSDGEIKNETEKFRDYWLAEGGQRARKRDWGRAYRNWLRRSREYGKKTRDYEAERTTARRRGIAAALAKSLAQDGGG